MALYEDLVRRALDAGERDASHRADAMHTSALAHLLRDANAGRVLLRHCAWCGRLEVGDEWLDLEAINTRQLRAVSALNDHATHGICPNCSKREAKQAGAKRANHKALERARNNGRTNGPS